MTIQEFKLRLFMLGWSIENSVTTIAFTHPRGDYISITKKRLTGSILQISFYPDSKTWNKTYYYSFENMLKELEKRDGPNTKESI